MTEIIWIVVLVGGFALGLYWGLPGRWEQTPEDIEKIMAGGARHRRRTRRVFTPLTWIQRRAGERSSEHRRTSGDDRPRGFRIERPEERLGRKREER